MLHDYKEELRSHVTNRYGSAASQSIAIDLMLARIIPTRTPAVQSVDLTR